MADMAHVSTMPSGHGTDHASDSSASRSPNPLQNFGIFKEGSVPDKKASKGDGQAPKRRGPKPDSKPAMTRRQELNRQAQRTHRERKELYIKALEQEVMRLKETYGTVCRDRDAFADENRKLRDMLARHGINCPADLGSPRSGPGSPMAASSSGSFSGSYRDPSSTTDPSPPPNQYSQQRSPQDSQFNGYRQVQQHHVNVDQVGINFVLALEKPCMDHSQMLCVRSQESDEEISGHALMATCPPVKHLIETPHIQYPHHFSPEVPGGDLLKLLDLSARLPLDGEITPVMAWAIIIRDGRFRLLNEQDILDIGSDLFGKIHCYGFGAVLEEFEVKDALEGALASKMNMLTVS